MHQTLVAHEFCLTQKTDAGPLLLPIYFNCLLRFIPGLPSCQQTGDGSVVEFRLFILDC